ncbi:hypothetical protein ED28_12305 [[Pantoea] beijingensis]|uniref:EAL domain-containing protein n=1 Tax=[Pantoea] beijingensis TaxID=1324864 RepID=A0A443IC73_9GAMM|nr:EAL domain-containing protein [[Pantoea] beijingensis]RWR01798.1 hypothetical protein ED28_12305 [[Pantoea] beijingensis]
MKDGNAYLFSFEPIYTVSGSLFAFELMTRCAAVENPNGCQQALSAGDCQRSVTQKITLFEEQIGVISDRFFSDKDAPIISVNIDTDISKYILGNLSMRNMLKKMPRLRFEVNEEIFHLNSTDAENWKKITQYCPVWLDRFGFGNSSLITVIDGHFEYVKISKDFFCKYKESTALRKLLDYIKPYCKGIIVEGAGTSSFRDLLTSLQIFALQGGFLLIDI